MAPPVKTGRKQVVGLELWCPWSGVALKVKGGVEEIKPHRLLLVMCDNGSLMAYCPHHVARVFTGCRELCANVRENYEFIGINKESSNVQSP